MIAAMATLRQSAGPVRLIARAVGGPRQVAGKLARLAETARLWASPTVFDQRLTALAARGYIERKPNRLQILFGGLDMLRFVIEPAARDYYRSKGISFGFHQLLRALDDPVSIVDPTGFLSARDTIIGHLMQVTHLNPVYDLQLLEMFPDGLDQLEHQVEQMVAGTHPRAATIGAIIEDPGYHERLLDYVREFRRDRGAAPPVRQEQTLRDDPVFAAAERTFATLPGFIGYCNQLPTGLPALVRRLRSTRRFPVDLAGPGQTAGG
jgi:hypothetical protein